ncbi:hypothetical protein OBBRIDRAFT_808900, partial [Obba rivulosa]
CGLHTRTVALRPFATSRARLTLLSLRGRHTDAGHTPSTVRIYTSNPYHPRSNFAFSKRRTDAAITRFDLIDISIKILPLAVLMASSAIACAQRGGALGSRALTASFGVIRRNLFYFDVSRIYFPDQQQKAQKAMARKTGQSSHGTRRSSTSKSLAGTQCREKAGRNVSRSKKAKQPVTDIAESAPTIAETILITRHESELAAKGERDAKAAFMGIAQIDLVNPGNAEFVFGTYNKRPLSEQQLKKLLDNMEKNGYQRYTQKALIPILVKREALAIN